MRTSGIPSRAVSAATMMSQASAISRPPPIAQPLTAAIVGLKSSKRVRSPPHPVPGRGGSSGAGRYFRSFPAEKARSPAPVRIATQRSGSAAKSSQISVNSSVAGRWRAFITSGRFIVMTARCCSGRFS